MMGYFRSNRYPLQFFLMKLTNAMEVSTPSATSVVESRISCLVSPFPNLYPNRRFRESGPKQVPNVSPTPERPAIVLGLAPRTRPSRRISPHPRVTRPLMALVPRPSPSHMPAARAITFLTAPPISMPMTSLLVKTRKLSDDMRSAKSSASNISSDATTTAVATPSQISRAKDGPDKKAYDRSSPKQSFRISAMNPKLDVSIPLEALRTGTDVGT
mmetsp:Transcript_8945/g.16292  ORF Transcript_8945/g.16292 Transcript_8945/m.16292 type:complete len:215 (+) Transcript_8945:144-788(+)